MLLLRWSILHDGPYYTDLPYVENTYVDAAYRYRPSIVVCRSVCLLH